MPKIDGDSFGVKQQDKDEAGEGNYCNCWNRTVSVFSSRIIGKV
jgi:hypothetical protein